MEARGIGDGSKGLRVFLVFEEHNWCFEQQEHGSEMPETQKTSAGLMTHPAEV